MSRPFFEDDEVSFRDPDTEEYKEGTVIKVLGTKLIVSCHGLLYEVERDDYVSVMKLRNNDG